MSGLDLINSSELAALSGYLTEDPRLFLLDFTGVAYMDSIGLQSVMTLGRAAAAQGVSTTVYVRSESNVHRVMRIVGANSVLCVVAESGALVNGPNPPTSRR